MEERSEDTNNLASCTFCINIKIQYVNIGQEFEKAKHRIDSKVINEMVVFLYNKWLWQLSLLKIVLVLMD